NRGQARTLVQPCAHARRGAATARLIPRARRCMVARMRSDGRRADQPRPITIAPNWLKDPEGSALVRAGDTWVVCAASVEERVPPWLKDAGTGWVTAEYSMLPRATPTRSSRAPSGRSKEIERLIGRALRASIDLARLGPRTITV